MICSGNHDYRSTGYLLFKRFFPSKQVIEAGDCVLAIVNTATPERNDGEVGHRQVVWLERTLARYKKKVKIVALHHHLIQVPDTGPDNILWSMQAIPGSKATRSRARQTSWSVIFWPRSRSLKKTSGSTCRLTRTTGSSKTHSAAPPWAATC